MITKNSFAVTLPSAANDRNGFYKANLLAKINQYPWLTVAGMDAPFTTNSGKKIRGIDYAGPGHTITFGTAKSHDINWVERSGYVCEKGYTPVYDLAKDFTTVVNKLDAFAAERKPRPVYNPYKTGYTNAGTVIYVGGEKVEIFDTCVKIGYNIIPRNATASTFYNYTPAQYKTVSAIVITIKNLYA